MALTLDQALSAVEEQLAKNRVEIKAAESAKARIWDEVQSARAEATKEILAIKAERKAERERLDTELPTLQAEETRLKESLEKARKELADAKASAETVLKDAERIHRSAEAEAQRYLDSKRKTFEELMKKYHAFKQALPESL